MQAPVKETFNAIIESVGYVLKNQPKLYRIELGINHDGSWGIDVYNYGREANLPECDNPYDQLMEAVKYIKEEP
jgi:hypothetical protein